MWPKPSSPKADHRLEAWNAVTNISELVSAHLWHPTVNSAIPHDALVMTTLCVSPWNAKFPSCHTSCTALSTKSEASVCSLESCQPQKCGPAIYRHVTKLLPCEYSIENATRGWTWTFRMCYIVLWLTCMLLEALRSTLGPDWNLKMRHYYFDPEADTCWLTPWQVWLAF